MNVTVFGLWHLGTVTAACLASVGHQVTGLDPNVETISQLQAGKPPLFEPGLEALVQEQIAAGRLRFTARAEDALSAAEVVWITFDTPVDDEDQADVEYVKQQVIGVFPMIPQGALVLISSQVPVGTTRQLEQAYREQFPARAIAFAYSPENLRLGKAINVFLKLDRVVVGVRSEADRARIVALFANVTDHIEWMSVEAAEMTKHALNAFLATSIVFMNELATLCEKIGVDAKEVERGLKTEARIGPGAYLSPGGAFGGGTLARDINFLDRLSQQQNISASLFGAVSTSNTAHINWPFKRLHDLVGELRGKMIAVLGLTYKPGTSTLRRSNAVALCRQLLAAGAQVRAHDPAVEALPAELAEVTLCATWQDALIDADALVIATEWPPFKGITAQVCLERMRTPLVIDANRFLATSLGADSRIRYFAVGKP